jgi:hypothetical protein
MPSQKLVRCRIRREGERSEGSTRYIPLEIFGLWEFLMRQRHRFEVFDVRASLWLDMEDAPEAAYNDNPFDRVTEVTAFVYSSRDDMFTRVCRYFPSDEVGDLKEIFLSHYPPGDKIRSQVREKTGIWIHRRETVEASA